MRRVHLPPGRAGRIVSIELGVVLFIGAAGALVLAARLLDPGSGAGPAPGEPSAALVTPAAPSPSAGASQPAPSLLPRPSPLAPPPATVWALPAGWRYEFACGDSECDLYLFDDQGRTRDGWPATLRGECNEDAAIGPDVSVFVACTRGDRAVITGLDRMGNLLPGWPVKVAGSATYGSWNTFGWEGGASALAVGPDGTVYAGVVPGDARHRFDIHAFARDGSPRDGWPRRLAGGAQGFTLAPDGTIVAWWYEGIEDGIGFEARRTVFTMLGRDGSTLPGWPIGSRGAASGPVVSADASIYYVSASGKVYGHDRTGEIIDGWPYQLPDRVPPELRRDGMLRFIGRSQVDILDRTGRPAPGWPYRTDATFTGPGCDTPGFDYQVFTESRTGRLYLAEWSGRRGSIVALEENGRIANGWPYSLPRGWRVTTLDVNDDEIVGAYLVGDGCGGGPDDTSLILTRDGELLGDSPGTPMSLVYEALRLESLDTLDGASAYPQGTDVVFEFRLVNRSTSSISLPQLDPDASGGVPYATGVLQTWLERLGPEPEMDCLPRAGRKDTWYATGGWIVGAEGPVTIPVGGSMEAPFQRILSADLTACLPPGAYRYHVEYKPIGADDEDEVIGEAFVELTIEPGGPGSPTWTPGPSPRSTPSATPRPSPSPTPLPTPSPSPPPIAPSGAPTAS